MIWALVREQVRSQRRYTLATAVLIAVTVALAAYGAFLAVTIMHTSTAVGTFWGNDRDSTAFGSFGDTSTFTAIPPHVDAANANGHEVVATAQVIPVLAPGTGPYAERLVAMYGDVDWSTVRVDGNPPAAGQIAVSAQWAAEHGVAIGDKVDLHAPSPDGTGAGEPIGITLTVSGLTRSGFAEAAIEIQAASGYVAWGDVPALNEAGVDAMNDSASPADLPVPDAYTVGISGNGDWQWSQSLVDMSGTYSDASINSSSAIAIGVLTGIAAAALIVGLVATAFALGRTQAQARSRWVGTARALGATKRHIAVATLLECGAVGLAAGIVGVALGGAAATAHLWLIASRIESPMLLLAPTGYAAVAAAGIVLALMLALIVGAVPAFWASRVEPAAALKPVQDVANVEISRRVWVWPIAVVWAASVVVVLAMTGNPVDGPAGPLLILAVGVVLATSVVLANEALRRSLPWHAKRLSRSKRRAVMVAGDAILARPRQATVPAFIVALATTIVISLFAQLVASWALSSSGTGDLEGANPYISPLMLLGVSIVVTFLCVVVGVATATVTAREAATREALGLTRVEGRAAAALQYLVAQAHGLGLGLVGGAIGGAIALRAGIDDPFINVGVWAGPVAHLVLVVIAIAGACALVGAAIVAAFAPRTAPLSRVEVSA